MSRIVNNYKAPSDPIPRDAHAHTPPEEYDHNFVFEVSKLRSSRVELRPFVPSLHAQALFDLLHSYPELLRWVPLDPVTCIEDVLVFVEGSRRDPTRVMWAIFSGPIDPDAENDPSQYEFAGTIKAVNSSAGNMVSELGFIMISPKFQRTHVLTHAAGILLHRILDSVEQGGWGLRRCQWFTNSLNTASANAALRLGFKFEGILRQHRVLLLGKEGVHAGRPGAMGDRRSRDSWLGSITWEEWESGVRDHIDGLMARRK